jgi:hypothetical protein
MDMGRKMITLNGNRTKPTLDDVLTELDAFEAIAMTTAKKFTAFILDIDREENDPLIVHFETTSGEMMHGDIETAYFYALDCGANVEGFDPEFVQSDSIGSLWCAQGAAVMGVIAGHHDAVWNIDGMVNEDYPAAFDLARKAEEKAAAADPFKETYRSAWLSTCHLTPATLKGLNDITSNRALPFWIHSTAYGWIIRFDALDAFGTIEAENVTAHWIANQPDIQAIKQALYKHGYEAAHLDADGPAIEGLEEYDHE